MDDASEYAKASGSESRGWSPQRDLEGAVARLYEPEGLAAMVLHRYPLAPIIRDYKITIREAMRR
jgi:hypothetical protein